LDGGFCGYNCHDCPILSTAPSDFFKKLKVKLADIMPIFEAINALSAGKQVEIESDLNDVEGMLCQVRVTGFTDKANFHQVSKKYRLPT
jgi:hypothetical protein